MKISAQLTVVMAVVFAIICFGVAITGFTSIGDIADPVQAADGRGFAWFWTFLGTICVLLAASSVWMIRTFKPDED